VTLDDLFFQSDADGATRAFMIAAFCAVWTVRRRCLDCASPVAADKLLDLVYAVIRCPWVENFLPTSTRKERRHMRARAPSPTPGAIVFRSDGALRRTPTGRPLGSGWGAARWSVDGTLVEIARGSLDIDEHSSNNVAEYCGLEAALRRSLEIVPPLAATDVVVFDVDSKVLAKQVLSFGADRYACRSDTLRPYYARCVILSRQLTQRGVRWRIRHIYREWNQVADSLANQAIDVGSLGWRRA